MQDTACFTAAGWWQGSTLQQGTTASKAWQAPMQLTLPSGNSTPLLPFCPAARVRRTFCSVRSCTSPRFWHFMMPCRLFIQLTLPRSVLISPADGAGRQAGRPDCH